MLSITPAGTIGVALHALARWLANSTTFRELAGATSEAQALDRIYYFDAPDELDTESEPGGERLVALRPRAIVDVGDDFGQSRDGTGYWRGDDRSLEIAFELVVPREYRGDRRIEGIWFANMLGKIMDEMTANSGQGSPGWLDGHGWEFAVRPFLADRDEEVEDFWGAVIRIAVTV